MQHRFICLECLHIRVELYLLCVQYQMLKYSVIFPPNICVISQQHSPNCLIRDEGYGPLSFYKLKSKCKCISLASMASVKLWTLILHQGKKLEFITFQTLNHLLTLSSLWDCYSEGVVRSLACKKT